MATSPDAGFVRSHLWFDEAIEHALDAAPALAAADAARARALLWRLLRRVDATNPSPAAAALTLEHYQGGGAAAQGIALAALIAAEFLAALDTVEAAVKATRDATDGNLSEADKKAVFALVGRVVRQVDGIVKGVDAAARYPSAFGLAKLMLVMSGDLQATVAAGQSPAQQLARFVAASTVGGQPSQAQIDNAASALGLFTALVGSLIDGSFAKALDAADFGWNPIAALPPLPATRIGPLQVGFGAQAGPARLSFELEAEPAKAGAQFEAALDLNASAAVGPAKVKLKGSAGLKVYQPLLPPGPAQVEGASPKLTIELSKKQTDGLALKLGPQSLAGFGEASLEVKEIGAGLTLALKSGALKPSLDVFLRDGVAKLTITDKLLQQVLSGDVSVNFSVEAQLDSKGKLHLKDGSGLRVSLPVPKLPTGPLNLQLIHLGIEPRDGKFENLDAELSASFAIELGPFKGSVDRLGVIARLSKLFGPGADPGVSFGLKPPNGAGLSLDAGVVKGGGYIYLDPDKGEYAGVLELKMMAIGIKAIAILNTKLPDAGWSLLLLIFGNFPPIQLSFGFTLTGIGGLIGLQHTISTDALSQGLSTGALDAILFPADPVADAPQIIHTLRGIFPTKPGGFVIGPMLEVGWGTPNLVTIRAGVLIEPSKVVILGQAIVQLPPLVDKDLAILRLQVDFVGYVIFDPFKLGFDGRLRDSRVLFITLTGSFAFRASFGAKPSFLLSAGGFHPRFKDIPDDVPAMERIGAGFSIGIVGVSFKGYFAVTSATIQGGSELRVWADVGIASFDGGFGYDVIVYLEPRLYFEADMRIWAKLQILGFTLGARIEGLLAGPGRWRAAGLATVDLGFFGEHSVDFDERWGDAVDTPLPTEDVRALLQGLIGKPDNWSAQLPKAQDSLVTLAKIEGNTELLAHPRSPLTFRQKALPLNTRLQRLGTKRPLDANRFGTPAIGLPAGASGFPSAAVKDHFAAAQFFDVKEEDRLQGPSFEAFDAGVSVAVDSFDFGPIEADSFEHEEVNLSAPERNRVSTLHLGQLAQAGWALRFGAVARSERRERLLPKTLVAIEVVNPAFRASERATGKAAAGIAGQAGNYWARREVMRSQATGVASAPAQLQLSEAFEALI
jgi:hypothetical protein